MLTIADFNGPGPPARPVRPRRAEGSPPVLRGAKAVVALASLTLSAPRVALTGRYRGTRVHAAAYVAALCAVLLACLALWGGAVGGGLLTLCETRLPAPLAGALCGASRVLVANEREGLRVVDTRGVRRVPRHPSAQPPCNSGAARARRRGTRSPAPSAPLCRLPTRPGRCIWARLTRPAPRLRPASPGVSIWTGRCAPHPGYGSATHPSAAPRTARASHPRRHPPLTYRPAPRLAVANARARQRGAATVRCRDA
jgi:hypothetical protein